MAHRNFLAIDMIMIFVSGLVRASMRDDLMAEEIEVHPFGARASFGTAEQAAIEGAGLGKIAYRKRKMKARTF